MTTVIVGLGAAPAPAAPATTPVVSEAADQKSAFATARRQGSRVEILDSRTERGQLFANPDGSLTASQHTQPVRVRRGSTWAPVDLTLTRNPDGSVSPRATVTGLRVSGGGDSALLTLSLGDKELSLTWPNRLPSPTLTGDTATYPEVYPGVDLSVKATVDGFTHTLTVRSRESARHVAAVRYGTSVRNLSLISEPDGTSRAVDAAGKQVFVSGTPGMWDSRNGGTRDMSAGKARSSGASAAVDPAGEGATEGAIGVQRDMPIQRTSEGFTVTPDAGMLNDPGTRYPVTIDPGTSMTGWLHVTSAYPDDKNWGKDVNDGGAKVGKYDILYRSYFNYSLQFPQAAVLSKASFDITLNHSSSCSNTDVELWRTDGVNTNSSWNNTVNTFREHVATVAGKANAGCGQNDLPMAFGGNLQSIVQSKITAGWTGITFGLKAPHESNSDEWKKFWPNPVLTITYNTPPNVPGGVTTSPATACGGNTNPVVLNTINPTFTGTTSDPDNNNTAALLEILDPAGTVVKELRVDGLASGQTFSWPQVPNGVLPANRPNDLYSYRARAQDTGNSFSGYSARCYFLVDKSNPALPNLSSTDYPNGEVGTAVAGRSGLITFTPGTGVDGVVDTDIAGYEYGFGADTVSANYVAAVNGRATVAIAVPVDQPRPRQDLYVRAVDRANNKSLVTAEYPSWVLRAAAENQMLPEPRNLLVNGGLEGAGVSGWTPWAGSTAVRVADGTAAHGAGHLRLNRGTAGGNGSVMQEVRGLNFAAGQSFEATAWVRAGGSNAVAVNLTLFARGGAVGQYATGRSVTAQPGEWTKLTVPIDIHDAGRDNLLVQFYEGAGGDIDVDLVGLFSTGLNSASFEGRNATGWSAWPGTSMTAYQEAGAAGGDSFLQANRGTASFGAVHQDVAGTFVAGTTYEGSVWVRSRNGSTLTGALNLWFDPGANQSVLRSSFTALPDVWTKVTVRYHMNEAKRTTIRFQVYLWGTGNLDIDEASIRAIVPTAPLDPALSLTSGSVYEVVNKNSGKCLDVTDAGTGDGAKIQQLTCHAHDAQRFTLQQVGDNDYYVLVARHSGRCLTANAAGENTLAMVQWACVNAARNQSFVLRYSGGTGAAATVELVPVSNPTTCVDVFGKSVADNAEVKQWTCRPDNGQAQVNQMFMLRPV